MDVKPGCGLLSTIQKFQDLLWCLLPNLILSQPGITKTWYKSTIMNDVKQRWGWGMSHCVAQVHQAEGNLCEVI